MEPAYKQHTVVDDKVGVILDVAVTTRQTNEGEMIEPQVDEVEAMTGINIKTVTADAGYAYAKVSGALERRGIDALIPAKAEPIKSRVPLRRFRYDAKHDIKCPQGRILRPARPIKHGRFFYSKAKDLPGVRSRAIAYPKGELTKRSLSVTIILHCSAPAAVASDGADRIDGFISAIAGAQRASTAKPRPGTDWRAPYGADYRT